MSEVQHKPKLPSFALFAGVLAAAGLPIYIHAPKFYVDEYGVSLAALGVVLGLLRLIDVVQDPLLGWLSEALQQRRGLGVAIGGGAMALAMIGLFAVEPPVAPLLWFALTLTVLFSGFSFLTINFYAQGVRTAGALSGKGHVRLATWRETGSLTGVSLAAVAPTALASVTGAPFAVFAVCFAASVVIALLAMRREWWAASGSEPASGIAEVLSDATSRRLLLIALVNATPVAVSSTLFLFFVESRLEAPGWEGPLLLAFFLAAAASAPVWGTVAARLGIKRALLAGMVLAILSFGFATQLGAGDTAAFAAICLASGAALGADLTLLPALFARHMAKVAPRAGQAFGLWSFVSKFTLALAAFTLLPILDSVGFAADTTQSSVMALTTLTLLYAGVPCFLKLIAVGLLLATPLEED